MASEDLIKPVAVTPADPSLPSIPEGDQRLTWGLPERDGGLSKKGFDVSLPQHKARVVAALGAIRISQGAPSIEELDPTQKAFA